MFCLKWVGSKFKRHVHISQDSKFNSEEEDKPRLIINKD